MRGHKASFRVDDTKKTGDLIVHRGQVTRGTLEQGEEVTAKVDGPRREGIRRAHSATHILHAALQQQLGTHAQQRGSKVTDDELRFDFTNLEPVPEQALWEIEQQSLRRIKEAQTITAEILPLADAKEQGAMMLFGEKYPDPVRMISMGEFSKELCGGTHLSNTSEVERFEIVSEEAVSSGTRRIVAFTGERAKQQESQTRETVQALEKQLGVTAREIPSVIESLAKRVKQLKKNLSAGKADIADEAITVAVKGGGDVSYPEARNVLRKTARLLNVPLFETAQRVDGLLKEIETLETQIANQGQVELLTADELLKGAAVVDDIHLVVSEVPGGNPNVLRGLIDQIRQKQSPSAVMLISILGPEKMVLVAGLSKDLVSRGMSAGQWVKEVAPTVGGGGGGKPDLAQAGGKQPDKINVALDAARDYIQSELAK